jgi:hypothetical protein
VHYPHDVLGGWLMAGAVLAIYYWVEPRVVPWLRRQTPVLHVLTAAALPAAILLAWGIAGFATAGAADPPEWAMRAAAAFPPEGAEPAIDPRSGNSIFTNTGVLFGAGLGLALANRRWEFDAGGPLWKRAARFGLGMVVVLGLRLGLGALLPDEPVGLGLALRFARYALIGFWVAGLAPWLFLKLDLAERGAMPRSEV